MPTTRRSTTLLDDPELDAILIATPVFTHSELALREPRAPASTPSSRSRSPRSAAEADEPDRDRRAQRACVLMCGHTFLYSPPVRAVKELLDAGELGDLYFISSSRVNLGLHQRDVSVIWDLGPHDFSILRYWLGEMPETVARRRPRRRSCTGIPDVAFVDLALRLGMLANVELSWLAPSKLRRTVIVGSEKMVVYEDGSPEPVRVFDRGVVYEDPETFGEYHLSYRTGDIVSPRARQRPSRSRSRSRTSSTRSDRAGEHRQPARAWRVDVVRDRGGRGVAASTAARRSRVDAADSRLASTERS